MHKITRRTYVLKPLLVYFSNQFLSGLLRQPRRERRGTILELTLHGKSHNFYGFFSVLVVVASLIYLEDCYKLK